MRTVTRTGSLAAVVADAVAFSVGYILVSRWATGGGVVKPSLYLDAATDEARWTVLGSVGAGLVAVLIWRTVYHLRRRSLR